MTSFPNSLRLPIVLLDPDNGAPTWVIVPHYNSDTLTRSLAPKSLKENGDRAEALRLKRLPVESLELDADIHAREGRNP
jgi:hypothetical protein